MSFKADNTYFIKLELVSKLKGLSTEERDVYYSENLKTKFRDKLRSSYLKMVDRANFYNDAFEVLGEFESDFLLLNLFFEPDQETILNKLEKGYFQELTANVKYLKNYKSHVEEILKVGEYKNIHLEGFLINEFEVMTEISIKNLPKSDRNQNSLQHDFAIWLHENFQDEDSSYVIIMFAKIWQIYFSNPFDSINAIVLLNNLLQRLDPKSTSYKTIDTASNTINSIFSHKNSLPITENLLMVDASNGYKTKKKQFDDFLKNSRLINADYRDIAYSDLHILYSQSSDFLLKQKLIDIITIKRNLFILPTEEDLTYLEKNSFDDDFCIEFNRIFYLFQNFDFK